MSTTSNYASALSVAERDYACIYLGSIAAAKSADEHAQNMSMFANASYSLYRAFKPFVININLQLQQKIDTITRFRNWASKEGYPIVYHSAVKTIQQAKFLSLSKSALAELASSYPHPYDLKDVEDKEEIIEAKKLFADLPSRDVVETILNRAKINDDTGGLFGDLLDKGNTTLAKLMANVIDPGCGYFYSVARSGNIDMAEWAFERGIPWNAVTMAIASSRGHTEMVKWLRSHGCPWDENVLAKAVFNGHLKLAKYLRSEGCPWGEIVMISAVRFPNIIKWLVADGCPRHEDATTITAAASRCLETLEILRAEGCLGRETDVYAVSVFSFPDAPNLIKYWKKLLAVTDLKPSYETLVKVVSSSRLSFIDKLSANEWARQQGAEFNAEVFSNACACETDALRLAKWLRLEECPWNATCITRAVCAGNYDVAEWLAESGCPCDTSALERFVGHGSCWKTDNFDLLFKILRLLVVNNNQQIKLTDVLLPLGHPLETEQTIKLIAYMRSNGCPWRINDCVTVAGSIITARNSDLGTGSAWLPWPRDASILEWMQSNGCLWNESTFAAAAGNRYVDLAFLKHLLRGGCPWDERTFSAAAGRCPTDPETMKILTWLRAARCPWGKETSEAAARAAVGSENRTVLVWLQEEGCPMSEDMLLEAIRCLEGLYHLCDSQDVCDPTVLRWISENHCPFDSRSARALVSEIYDRRHQELYLQIYNSLRGDKIVDELVHWAFDNNLSWRLSIILRKEDDDDDDDDDDYFSALHWLLRLGAPLDIVECGVVAARTDNLDALRTIFEHRLDEANTALPRLKEAAGAKALRWLENFN